MFTHSPIVSLAESGLDNVYRVNGVYQVHVVMESCYLHGDAIYLDYEGPLGGKQQKKLAQDEAILDILCLLLGGGPQSMRLAPGSLKNGAASIVELCASAGLLHQKLLEARSGAVWAQVWTRALGIPTGTEFPPVSDSRKFPIYQEGETELDREEQCLASVGTHLRVGVEYQPWHLRADVWKCFQENLEKGSLKMFMRREVS
jgi:hypothetical protein